VRAVGMHRWAWWTLLAVLVGGLAVPEASADLAAGRAAIQKGAWTEAEAELKKAPPAEKGPALLALSELYLTTGRHAEALQQATAASAIPATKGTGLRLSGEVFLETGRTAEAIKAFQSALAASPRDLRARILLGLTYRETGQEALATQTFDLFFQDFNSGKIDAKQADQLTYTAMAACSLEAWQDANGTFQDAVERDPAFLLANLEWGDLFLRKYRADEAAKC
jgi:tetratricopeptide (TPR) repeat protein